MTPALDGLHKRALIEAHQCRKLRDLVGTLLASNEFYQAKLSAAGLERCPDKLSDFFTAVPFTTKAELVDDQALNPPFGSNLTYSPDAYNRFHQTSGTQGIPLRWLDTRESWDWVVECWIRVYRSAGISSQDRVFFPFSFGPFLGFWGAFDAAATLGCLTIPGGGMRSSARLKTILDNRVSALCTTPTYAIHLAQVAHEEQIELSAAKVRKIILAGEPGGSIPATRSRVSQLWNGARVIDHHGMTETGPVTYECPECPGVLHVMEASYVPEVIHTHTLHAAEPGETGELVLTNLERVGSPILRYRTGDIVRRAREVCCACGSQEMALEGGILGRIDDRLIVRGVNLYPSALEQVIRSSGAVAEFKVEIHNHQALTNVSIQIEPSMGEDGASLAQRLHAALHDAFALRIDVVAVAPGTLPRFEAKARRWVFC